MADGVHGYTWNAADEITSVSGVATYAYDAHGKRIKTTLANGTVEYAVRQTAGDASAWAIMSGDERSNGFRRSD